MTTKLKTIITAFSGLIAYSALCLSCGYIFTENAYIRLVACSLTMLIGGLYLKTVLKNTVVWQKPSSESLAVITGTIVVFSFVSMLTARFLLSGVVIDTSFAELTDAKAALPPNLQLLTMIISFSFAPLAEEIIFRGLMYQQLSGFSKTFALFFTAAVFALWHGTIIHLYTAFVGGLILCLVYEKTQRLSCSFAAHAAFNILTTVAGMFAYPDWMMTPWFIVSLNVILAGFVVLLYRVQHVGPIVCSN